MPNLTHTRAIVTAHDLADALHDVAPSCRVVLVDAEGRVRECEMLVVRVGDCVGLMVCEGEVEQQ